MKLIGTLSCPRCKSKIVAVQTDDTPPMTVLVDSDGPYPGVAAYPAVSNPIDHTVEGLVERSKWKRGPVFLQHECQKSTDEGLTNT